MVKGAIASIHRRVRDRRRAGAVQVGQFATPHAIRLKTTIAVTVALWHRPAGGRLRDGSRYNTLKITDCVNAFTLVFCEDAYGRGVQYPFEHQPRPAMKSFITAPSSSIGAAAITV